MTESVFLVGFMGSGKSTVGLRLAERLGLPFADLDDDIVAKAGRSIADIFAGEGEGTFRDLEHGALAARVARTRAGEGFVLALGGGAYTFERNRDLLTGIGKTVWLDIPFADALRRVSRFDHRPLAKDPEAFRKLYEGRLPHYGQAPVRVPVTSDDPEETVCKILEALR